MEPWFSSGLHNLYKQPPLFESVDPAMTKSKTSGILKEHRLTWSAGQVNSALRCVEVGRLSFMLLRYGAAVHIAPGALQDFYLFQIPVQGNSIIGVGEHTVNANKNTATIISPQLDVTLDWEENCEQFLVKVPKALLNEACMQLLAIAPDETVLFQPQYNMNNAHGLAWQHLLSTALAYANPDYPAHEQWLKIHEQNLLQHLLLTQPNNYSHYFHKTPRMTGQRRLRLARHYIEKNISESIKLEDIAKACDSSVRSLTEAFKVQLSISPTLYIRKRRLERVRQELIKAKPTEQVTEIAIRWGFNHLGRFSAWYKEIYGESPYQTLQK